MSELRQLTELMGVYSSAMKKFTVHMEVLSQGEVKTAVENLREVYAGHGADSFFTRWDNTEHNLSECVEDILSLQMRLEQWVNALESLDQSGGKSGGI